jgi:hypothetical protein
MTATFPTGVWDGTTGSRPSFSVSRGPSGIDWDRAMEEIIAMQRHLLGGPFIKAARTITIASDNMLFEDYGIYLDATSNNVQYVLGDPSLFEGKIIVVKRMDGTANTVTIVGTVDDIVNPTLTSQFDALTLQAHNGLWRIQ